MHGPSGLNEMERSMHLPSDLNEKVAIFRDDSKPVILERARKLTHKVLNIFNKFRMTESYVEQEIEVSIPTLNAAMVALWRDVVRLQTCHPINIPDRHKYAAFIFKWICKFKPLKFVAGTPDGKDGKELFIHVNEVFAFYCAYGILKSSRPKPVELTSMLYSAASQEIYPEQWSLIFYYMEIANPEEREK